ncbi:MAG: hypothetical protein EBU49_01345 [Proteobacteria bacterium]|nr:hypothetical protein [Pseudomonadota bacterium]
MRCIVHPCFKRIAIAFLFVVSSQLPTTGFAQEQINVIYNARNQFCLTKVGNDVGDNVAGMNCYPGVPDQTWRIHYIDNSNFYIFSQAGECLGMNRHGYIFLRGCSTSKELHWYRWQNPNFGYGGGPWSMLVNLGAEIGSGQAKCMHMPQRTSDYKTRVFGWTCNASNEMAWRIGMP